MNDCNGQGVEMNDIFIVNNTIWGNGGTAWRTGAEGGYGLRVDNPGGQNIYAVNNIFAENWKQQLKIHEQVRYDDETDGVDADDPVDPEKLVLQNNT